MNFASLGRIRRHGLTRCLLPLPGIALVATVLTGCNNAGEAATETTQTVTVTADSQPQRNIDTTCEAPIVDFDAKWERIFGEGIPPQLKTDEVIPPAYFEAFQLKRAVAEIRNISPHQINIRGIDFDVLWVDRRNTLQTTRYTGSIGLPYDTRSLPKMPPVGSAAERKIERVGAFDSIRFERDYPPQTLGGTKYVVEMREVHDGSGPYTWVSEIDWWFDDPDVRKKCGKG